MQITLTGPADVHAVLADPRFAVPPAPHASGAGIAWLRASVARFSSAADHRRRRGYSTADLDRISPATLRRHAYERAAAAEAAPVTDIARRIPVTVLATALGADADPEAVALVAAAYHPGSAAGPDADRAVARLVDTFGGTADEATAARIGLLVQAHAATAGLIGNAAARRSTLDGPVETLVDATLRDDPPVRATRRITVAPARIGDVDIDTGTVVHLDLTAAPFGAGPHRCPGREHATAIASGVLAALRDRGFHA